jgi:hypothetical protein
MPPAPVTRTCLVLQTSEIIFRFTEVLDNSQFMRNIYKENSKLFEYISVNVGEKITDIVNLDYIFNTLLITSTAWSCPSGQRQCFQVSFVSLRLHCGFHSASGGKFKELRDLSFTDTFNQEMKRLKGGTVCQGDG